MENVKFFVDLSALFAFVSSSSILFGDFLNNNRFDYVLFETAIIVSNLFFNIMHLSDSIQMQSKN